MDGELVLLDFARSYLAVEANLVLARLESCGQRELHRQPDLFARLDAYTCLFIAGRSGQRRLPLAIGVNGGRGSR